MFVVLLFIVACVVSSNETNDFKNAKILENEYKEEFPNYYFKNKALNGFSRVESGQFELTETGDVMFVVRGVYTFRDADGNLHTRRYLSDYNGFKEIEPKIQSRLGSSAITTLQGGGLG
ncbi:hypothetical protein FQR65_LT01133 [Abscondita terminalis]|nr:hypothetical protein FQR65_LT01133 [Abscondita terminalis]